ncbi:MAG: LysR family transcriptional regulator [Christensenellales bacterium]|nr:LysR family transcriptional regulator [bacterium]
MNTQHLKYVVEVERTGSITQAADNLYMAQPNLSKAIKELEDTLGISIFRRTSKGVVPTEKGAEFLVYAKRILTQLEKVEALNLPRTEERQSFSVSVPRVSYIAKAVTRFVASLDPQKELDVNVRETGSQETIAQVAEGQFNLGVVRYRLLYENYFTRALAERELRSEPIWEADCYVTVSAKHPLAQKRAILPDDLSGCIELVNDDADVPYLPAHEQRRYQTGGTRLLRQISIYDRANQFELLERIPNAYMWATPIPKDMLLRYGLVQRESRSGEGRSKDVLIYPAGYAMSPLEQRFINELYVARNEVAFPGR